MANAATTIVAVLAVHAHQDLANTACFSALRNPKHDRIDQVLLVLTVMLSTLAAVNAILITHATASENRHSSALIRALGATADRTGAALSLAVLIPALPGVLLGVPAGPGLVSAAGHGSTTTVPPA